MDQLASDRYGLLNCRPSSGAIGDAPGNTSRARRFFRRTCHGPGWIGHGRFRRERHVDGIRVARTPSYGIKYILVSTLTPPGPYVAGSDRRIAADAIVRTNTQLAQAVRAEGAILVDSYALFIGHESAYVDDDGLHLRPAGYQAVAEAFFAAIKRSVTTTFEGAAPQY